MALTLKNHLGLTNYCHTHTHTQKRKPFFGLWFKTFKDLLFIKLSVELKQKTQKTAINEEDNQQERLHVSPGNEGEGMKRDQPNPPLFSKWATVSVIADSFLTDSVWKT